MNGITASIIFMFLFEEKWNGMTICIADLCIQCVSSFDGMFSGDVAPRSAEHVLDIIWRDLRSVVMECAHHNVAWIMDAK